MAFICYECHKKTACKWPFHVPPKAGIAVGEDEITGAREEVYGRADNVSFGQCEDCGKSKPCVNCRG